MLTATKLRERRKERTHFRIRQHANGRPRLAVFRSNKRIYAQVIDDTSGETIASASSLEPSLREGKKSACNREVASAVGKLVAERAAAKGVSVVVFDRGPYLYHGRVRALADAAREAGLNF